MDILVTRELIENHSRVFNTTGSYFDSTFIGYGNGEHRPKFAGTLYDLSEEHHDLRQRCHLWVQRRANLRLDFANRMDAQLRGRPDLVGRRKRHFFSPACFIDDKERSAEKARVFRELKVWAEGRNPSAPLTLLDYVVTHFPQRVIERLPPVVESAISKYHRLYTRESYEPSLAWIRSISRGVEISRATLVRISEEDPMQVRYIQNITKLMHSEEGLWARTRPGRFLAKFHPELSEAEVKTWVEHHEAEHRPIELKFVENTDPDGWEWVYEHAEGFSSCMQYRHPHHRYMHRNCHGENHPVRQYAYPGNGLRLAWFGDKEKGKVFGRAIVRDDGETKGYVRVYGDQRIVAALQKAGYGRRVTLEGVKIGRREADWDDDILIVPYLDSIGYVEDCGTHLLITEDGDISADDSEGLVSRRGGGYQCPRCDEWHDDEDDIMYSDFEERSYCTSCEDDFTLAVVRVGRYGREQGMVLNHNVIEVNGDYYYDDTSLLHECGFAQCDECGEWEEQEAMFSTSRGEVCGCTRVVPLDIEDSDGFSYAVTDDAIKVVRDDTLAEVYVHEETEFSEDGVSECGTYLLPGSPAHSRRLQPELELEPALEAQAA
jgi:hypothetical protein